MFICCLAPVDYLLFALVVYLLCALVVYLLFSPVVYMLFLVVVFMLFVVFSASLYVVVVSGFYFFFLAVVFILFVFLWLFFYVVVFSCCFHFVARSSSSSTEAFQSEVVNLNHRQSWYSVSSVSSFCCAFRGQLLGVSEVSRAGGGTPTNQMRGFSKDLDVLKSGTRTDGLVKTRTVDLRQEPHRCQKSNLTPVFL